MELKVRVFEVYPQMSAVLTRVQHPWWDRDDNDLWTRLL